MRPEIVAEVDQILAGATRPMIGVHYRHPGHNSECPSPIPPVSEFVRRVRKIARGREVAIVLATDVEHVVEEFRAAFGANLIVQKGVQRSATDTQRHERTSDDGSLDDARQVLIDALMPARCDVLVHVTSNIVTAAAYLNPSLRMVYCETALEPGATGLGGMAGPWLSALSLRLRGCRGSARSSIASGVRRRRTHHQHRQ